MIGPEENVFEEVEEVGACFCESCGRIGMLSILLVIHRLHPLWMWPTKSELHACNPSKSSRREQLLSVKLQRIGPKSKVEG